MLAASPSTGFDGHALRLASAAIASSLIVFRVLCSRPSIQIVASISVSEITVAAIKWIIAQIIGPAFWAVIHC